MIIYTEHTVSSLQSGNLVRIYHASINCIVRKHRPVLSNWPIFFLQRNNSHLFVESMHLVVLVLGEYTIQKQ